MIYRVENKYLVSESDLAVLSGRLSALMPQDEHQAGDCYEIRSIYFDDIFDRCRQENDAGVDDRKKYRIRIYGHDSSFTRLEIKQKKSGFTRKTSCMLSRDEYEALFTDGSLLPFGDRKPLNELLVQMRFSHMRPKIIVSYERRAFVYPAGNVRITFDRNISASKELDCFFDERIYGAVPVLPVGMHILEVKYDEFLPDIIGGLLETGRLRQTAFSKYYLGRLAIDGDFPAVT